MGNIVGLGPMKPTMGGSRGGFNGTIHHAIPPFYMESTACKLNEGWAI